VVPAWEHEDVEVQIAAETSGGIEEVSISETRVEGLQRWRGRLQE
jgi:hypothetical protein